MMAYIGAALQHSQMLTLEQFSHMIAAGFSGMFVGTIVFGMGSDYFGRRTSFVLMLLIYSICTLLGAFAPNAWSLIVWRGLAGVGIGAELVVIDTYVTEMLPSKARGRYVAITQLVGFTAIPVVALLSKLLVPTHWLLEGWRWVMVIGGIGGLFAWYIRRRLPESPRWCEARGRHAEADAIMQEIEREVLRETGRPLGEPEAVAVTRSERMPIRELWQPAYRGRTLMLMVFHLLQTVGLYGFANWAPTFLLKQGKSLGQSLEYGFLIALVSPIGPLIAVLTAEHLERKRLIVWLSLLMAGSGLLFPLASEPLAIVGVGALLTIFSYWFSAVLHAYQAELFPTRARATGVGIHLQLEPPQRRVFDPHHWTAADQGCVRCVSFYGSGNGWRGSGRWAFWTQNQRGRVGTNFRVMAGALSGTVTSREGETLTEAFTSLRRRGSAGASPSRGDSTRKDFSLFAPRKFHLFAQRNRSDSTRQQKA